MKNVAVFIDNGMKCPKCGAFNQPPKMHYVSAEYYIRFHYESGMELITVECDRCGYKEFAIPLDGP